MIKWNESGRARMKKEQEEGRRADLQKGWKVERRKWKSGDDETPRWTEKTVKLCMLQTVHVLFMCGFTRDSLYNIDWYEQVSVLSQEFCWHHAYLPTPHRRHRRMSCRAVRLSITECRLRMTQHSWWPHNVSHHKTFSIHVYLHCVKS